MLPQFITYYIPGSDKHRGNKTAYLKEDLSLSPSQDYYFPIGYIPKYDHSKDINSQNNNQNEEEKGQIANIKKHYRRFYRTELEKVPNLNIKSPFYTA